MYFCCCSERIHFLVCVCLNQQSRFQRLVIILICGLVLQNVAAGRIAKLSIFGARYAEWWCCAHAARTLAKPFRPRRPPGTIPELRICLLGIRVYVIFARLVRRDLIIPAMMPRFADDTGVMSAAGQHEGELNRIRQQADPVYRAPGCDVVLDRADREDRHANMVDGNRAPADFVTALRQVVVQEQAPQIL